MAYALDINDDGVAVGVGFLPADGEAISVAVWWPELTSGPQRLDVELGLDQRSGSRALRVNDRGQILVSGGGRLVLVNPAAGSTQEVLVPFAERPIVLFEAGLNNAGDIVGSVVVDEVDTGEGVYAITHAFRWSAATLEAVDLGTLPGTESSHAYDINDAGQIVGDSAGQPFVWDPVAGVMTALDIPVNPGQISLMRINNAGLVLGSPAVWDLEADALVSAAQRHHCLRHQRGGTRCRQSSPTVVLPAKGSPGTRSRGLPGCSTQPPPTRLRSIAAATSSEPPTLVPRSGRERGDVQPVPDEVSQVTASWYRPVSGAPDRRLADTSRASIINQAHMGYIELEQDCAFLDGPAATAVSGFGGRPWAARPESPRFSLGEVVPFATLATVVEASQIDRRCGKPAMIRRLRRRGPTVRSTRLLGAPFVRDVLCDGAVGR